MKAKEFLQAKGWEQGDTGMFDLSGLANLLEEYSKGLQQYKDSTTGLWATDRPELVQDPEKVLFKL